MKFEIIREGVEMIPENPMDLAFIEDTLGLIKKGDSIPFTRISPYGLDAAIACIQAKKIAKNVA